MTVVRMLAVPAAMALLAGCQTLETIVPPQPVPVAAPSHPSYCYRTLAAVNCYMAPRPGDTLVGVDVPLPAKQGGSPAQPHPLSEPPPRPAGPTPVSATMPPSPAMAPPPPEVTREPVAPPPAGGPARLTPYGDPGRNDRPNDPIYGYSPPAAPAPMPPQ